MSLFNPQSISDNLFLIWTWTLLAMWKIFVLSWIFLVFVTGNISRWQLRWIRWLRHEHGGDYYQKSWISHDMWARALWRGKSYEKIWRLESTNISTFSGSFLIVRNFYNDFLHCLNVFICCWGAETSKYI